MQPAAPPPEDRGGVPLPPAHPRPARRDGPGRGGRRPGLRIRGRRHRGVHRRPRGGGRLLLPGDEHPPPGGAPRHRGRGHDPRRARNRPGGGATAGRAGRGAAVHPGRRRTDRARGRVPDLRRGPGPGLPAHRRPGAAARRTRLPRRAGGLRDRRGRRRHLRLRPDAGQGRRVGHRPRGRAAAGRRRAGPLHPPGLRGEHGVPARPAGPPRGGRREPEHRTDRAAAAGADRPQPPNPRGGPGRRRPGPATRTATAGGPGDPLRRRRRLAGRRARLDRLAAAPRRR